MPPRKQIHIYVKETAIYPAIVEYLQQHPLFADCDFDTLELKASVKKAPPYIRDIDTPITNLERYACNNAHLIEYYRDEQLILKKDLAWMMKISRPTLDKCIKAGFIKQGSSKYLRMELYLRIVFQKVCMQIVCKHQKIRGYDFIHNLLIFRE